MKKIFSVQEIIPIKARKRFPMYTGEWTLNSIWIYFCGYLHALDQFDIVEERELDFTYFQQYVRDKLGFYSPSVGWKDIILAHSLFYKSDDVSWEDIHKKEKQMTHEEHVHSTDIFFQFLDEFYSLSLTEFYATKMSRISPNFFVDIEKETFTIGFNKSPYDMTSKYTIVILEKYKDSYVLFYDFSSFEKTDLKNKDNYHQFNTPHDALHYINSRYWTELEDIVVNTKVEEFNPELAFK